MKALVGAAALVLALHVLGGAFFVVRMLEAPLVWLSTFAHETGHGLAALAMGASFDRLVIHWDGSGVAWHSGALTNVGRAVTSAGGLVGPALLAAVFFGFGTRPLLARAGLAVFGAAMLAVAALYVRNAFGLAFTFGTGAVLVALAWWLSSPRAQTAVLFLAIQLALSVFSRADYLFTATARTGSGEMPSDTAHIASALGGHYLAWGLAVGALSVLILAGGLLGVWLVGRDHDRRTVAQGSS